MPQTNPMKSNDPSATSTVQILTKAGLALEKRAAKLAKDSSVLRKTAEQELLSQLRLIEAKDAEIEKLARELKSLQAQ